MTPEERASAVLESWTSDGPTPVLADMVATAIREAIEADRLEDAGYPDGDLLRHLRGQEGCSSHDTVNVCDLCGDTSWMRLRGPHDRGCWALDYVRGAT